MWPFDNDRKQREAEALAAIRQAEMEERRQEREAYLTAIQSMMQLSIESSKAAAAQAAALTAFLEGFKVTGNPASRVVDDRQDFENYLRKTMHDEGAIKAAMADYALILDHDFTK